MNKHARQVDRWTAILTALFLALSVLVVGGYALIWFNPYLPINPFPSHWNMLRNAGFAKRTRACGSTNSTPFGVC